MSAAFDESTTISVIEKAPKTKDENELMDFLKTAMQIDPINLDKEALNRGSVYFKVQQELQLQARALGYFTDAMSKLKESLRLYYDGRLPSQFYDPSRGGNRIKFPPKNQTELNELVKNDDLFMMLNQHLRQAESKVKLCEETLKQVSMRHWDIKTALDFRKMMEGVQ